MQPKTYPANRLLIVIIYILTLLHPGLAYPEIEILSAQNSNLTSSAPQLQSIESVADDLLNLSHTLMELDETLIPIEVCTSPSETSSQLPDSLLQLTPINDAYTTAAGPINSYVARHIVSNSDRLRDVFTWMRYPAGSGYPDRLRDTLWKGVKSTCDEYPDATCSQVESASWVSTVNDMLEYLKSTRTVYVDRNKISESPVTYEYFLWIRASSGTAARVKLAIRELQHLFTQDGLEELWNSTPQHRLLSQTQLSTLPNVIGPIAVNTRLLQPYAIDLPVSTQHVMEAVLMLLETINSGDDVARLVALYNLRDVCRDHCDTMRD
jgi:hypothetical protein